MKILVILGHPDPLSFNHALAHVVCKRLRGDGHQVIFHDLYAEKFDPFLPKEEIPQEGFVPAEIRAHCEELRSADGIVIVHPNWWGQPPAVLKGWIDRVFRPGIAYRFEEGDNGEGVPMGLLKAKSAVVLNTSNTPMDRELEIFGDPLQNLWETCILDFSGVKKTTRRNFSVVITSTAEQRKAWLEEVEALLKQSFPAEQESAAEAVHHAAESRTN